MPMKKWKENNHMALENMNNMLRKAYKEHYAVGQFNINNVEWT